MAVNVKMFRRDADRVPYAAQLMIVRGMQAWFADLYDLSTGGCAIFRPDDWAADQDECVQLFFHRGRGAATCVPARIARVTRSLVGIEYHDPQPVPPCA
jgi:hypothetical protein